MENAAGRTRLSEQEYLDFERSSEEKHEYAGGEIFAMPGDMLASQKQARLEVFTRQPDGSWTLRIYGPGDRATLASIESAIEVDSISRNVFESVE